MKIRVGSPTGHAISSMVCRDSCQTVWSRAFLFQRLDQGADALPNHLIIYSGRSKSESANKIGSVFGNGSDRVHGSLRIRALTGLRRRTFFK